MANNWKYGDSYFDGNSYKTRALAFAAARKNGSGVFTYKGKQYNTMQKGENADDFRKNHADYDYFLGNVASDLGGWKPSDPVQTSYKVNNVPEPMSSDALPKSGLLEEVVVTAQKQPLQMFTKDDIKSLGFNNYLGLLNAVSNRNNWNNNFVKALNNRFGTDYANWKLEDIENALGVKGKYRSFGGGDFGDMSRSMANWMGTYNENLERKNLQDRTGSDGIVYSNKQVRDLFEAHPIKPRTSIFDTSSFGTNLFGTPKKQQGGLLNMNEQQLQLAFIQYLMQKTGALSELQLELVMQLMGEEGLKQAYAQFIQEMLQQQVQAAKFGAKLTYIKRLNGQCPEGTELQYYKVGGRLCKKCMLAKLTKAEEPSDPIDAFKCGRKVKKHLLGGSFLQAFNKARSQKHRYFWYKGKTYNTMNRGENKELWAKNFIDNSTSGGSNSVQTDVGYSGGWQGVKGANVGRYDSHGNWIRAKAPAKNAVVGARGDSVRNSDYKTFAPIDKPTDTVVVNGRGTDRGVQRANKTKGYSIGTPIEVSPYIAAPLGSTPIVNFLPGGYPSNGGSYVTTPITPWPWLQK